MALSFLQFQTLIDKFFQCGFARGQGGLTCAFKGLLLQGAAEGLLAAFENLDDLFLRLTLVRFDRLVENGLQSCGGFRILDQTLKGSLHFRIDVCAHTHEATALLDFVTGNRFVIDERNDGLARVG